MKLKNVFLSVGMFIFAFAMFGLVAVNATEANTCVVQGTGTKDWHTVSNWGSCGGVLPQAADTVQIPTNVALTMSGDATVTAVIFDDAAGNSNSLALNGHTLTVSGAITMPLSSDAGNETITVGTGTLNAGSISITGGASGISSVTVSTGSITTTGDITLGGATAITKALLTSTGASTISVGGNLTNTLGTVTNVGTLTVTGNLTGGGTVVNGSNGALYLNGTTNTVSVLTATAAGNSVFYGGGAQTVIDSTSHTYYNLYLQGSGAKTLTGITTIQGLVLGGTATATTAANIVIGANLIVGSGTTLTLADYSFSVATTSSISGTVNTATAATGTKTFTGLVTVNAGGVFNLSGQNPVTAFGAGITNNSATAMNLGSGASTLTGNLAGTGAITWGGQLTIAGAQTSTNSNTGVVTVTGTLVLTGNWTQGTNSNLVLVSTTPTSGAGTFVATLANTVTYSGAAQTIQTVATPGYYNLTLSGSGVKTATAADLIVNQTLTITAGTLSLATANTNTAHKLYFGTAYQRSGTWGSTGSATPAAAHENDTYFTAAADGMITVAVGHTTSTSNSTQETITVTAGGTTTTTPAATTTTVTPATPATPANVATPAGCENGAKFSTVTGKNCNAAVAATPASASKVYNLGTTTLKNGSRGEAAKELQRFLNDKLSLGLVVDGIIGPKTIAVMKTWQKNNGLVADGLIGPKTKAMINK